MLLFPWYQPKIDSLWLHRHLPLAPQTLFRPLPPLNLMFLIRIFNFRIYLSICRFNHQSASEAYGLESFLTDSSPAATLVVRANAASDPANPRPTDPLEQTVPNPLIWRLGSSEIVSSCYGFDPFSQHLYRGWWHAPL